MRKTKSVIYIIIITFLIIGTIGCFIRNYYDKGRPQNNTEDIPDEYEVDWPDAESYYENNSKVLSEVEANDSDNVLTEAEVYSMLASRGFEYFHITSNYTMDGEYYEAEEISNDSSMKHPVYETNYINENGDVWTVFVIDGVLLANPVSYSLQSESDVQVIFSESNTVVSYDSVTNKFFESIPDLTIMKVVTVERIDAQLFETLNAEETDKYVN